MALQQIANTDISSTGTFALGSVSSSTLTSGRVTYATTGGLLTDSSSLTFNGSTLTASSLSGGNITNTNLTSGRITYAATGGLLTDSANLVFTGSNVGIGTSSPADALNIGTGKKFRATHSANVYQQIFSSASGNFLNAYGDNLGVYADVGAISLSTTAAQPITFETTNAERMRISAAGLVGIGTISPDAQLDVTRSGNGQIAVLQTSSSRGFSFESQSDTALQISSVQASTNMDLWANTLSFSAGGSERMRITSAGLVGIGTATPARVLELKAAQACMVFNDNTNVWTIGTGSFIDGSNSFNFYLGGVGSYLRINASGNLGLGLGLVPSAWLASSKAMQIGDYASFWWDGYTGSTAIGNNVYQSGNTTDNYIVSGVASTRYRLAGGAHAWFIAPSGTAGNAISFTQAMTLNASGNLGIGTTSPAAFTGFTTNRTVLQIANTTSDSGQIILGGSTNALLLDYNNAAGDVTIRNTYGASAAGALINIDSGTLVFRTGTSYTERMRITSDGSLSLTKTGASPIIRRQVVQGSYGLIIQGNASDTINDTNPGASITVGGGPLDDTYEGNITIIAYGAVSASGNRNAIEFRNRSGVNTTTERMRIDYAGNLLVGTSSSIGNGGIFQAKNPVNGAAAYFEIVNNQGGNQNAIDITSVTNAAFRPFRFYVNGYGVTEVGSVACTTTATAYNTSSDYRLKNSIAPMTEALAKVALLKPVTYRWNSDGSDGQGFIAHELQAVVPDCVTGEKDAVDANGKPIYQGMDVSFLVATLVSAIQEQQALIESMATKLKDAGVAGF